MKREQCEECGGKIVKKKVDFKLYGESLGAFSADVCSGCGEEVFDEKTADEIDDAAKKKGLWGLGANAKVVQVGSSIALVINKKIADFVGLKKGEEVHIHPENKKKVVIDIY
ncbi:YgiT-type zinc finger protein [Candidatus Woesearchaeota archaeon]|nr:YgiT-type zinc finger protein [Candidatus Woesearchaeota archaeon]